MQQNGLSWQDQYEMAQSLASDADSTNLTVIKNLLRVGQKTLESSLNIDYNIVTRNFTTVTDAITGTSNQAYYIPENFRRMVSLYVVVGTTKYTGEQIFNEDLWLQMNATITSTSNYLQFFFIRGNRIELYPVPSSASTATMIYQESHKALSADNYSEGTITTLTNGATAVTASGSTFTAAMVGRYFRIDDDMAWYKIASFGTTTTLTLAEQYQGTSIAAGTDNYTIAEFPTTPADTHVLPVYFALWKLALFRKDVQMAREWERQWKEGISNAQSDYANLNASNIVESRPVSRGWRGVNPNMFPENMS